MALKYIFSSYGSGEYFLAKNQICENFLPHAGEVVTTLLRLVEILMVKEETSEAEDFTKKHSTM